MKKTRLLILTLMIAAAALFPAAGVRATGKNKVGLVVQYGDGSVITKCVHFEESGITGYEVLNLAGLNPIVEFSGMGAAVCKIKSDGCNFPSESCFCKCQGNPCKYWVYHHLIGGSWQYSNFGASNYQVKNGDVEGWAWGEGSPTGGLEPPIYTFDQLCGENATPTNTEFPPTATPVSPTATWTVAAPTVPPTSEPPALTATPTPQLTTGDFEIDFWADSAAIDVGACTTLHWETENVQAVYLDGEGVLGSGARSVCPTQTTNYVLTVKTASGDQKRGLTVNVTAAQTAVAASSRAEATAVVSAEGVLTLALLPDPTPTVKESGMTVMPPPNVPVGEISLPARQEEAPPAPTGELAMVVISAPTLFVLPAADQYGLVTESTPVLPDVQPDSYQEPVLTTVERSPSGYLVFSMITMGLAGWLAATHLRKQ